MKKVNFSEEKEEEKILCNNTEGTKRIRA